jgi:mannose-6-phosphate isomerase
MLVTVPLICRPLQAVPEVGKVSKVVLESEERPWGSWHVIDVADGYKVKRIHVNPGSRLSYQTHQHRSEHWVVIFGTATCTINDVVTSAGPGESVDVAVGAKHRIANDGVEELVIVEVQQGAYTGEDDIVRLDDDFGRCR